nr:phosphoribosyltransferase family protein [Actinomyces bowdenii]
MLKYGDITSIRGFAQPLADIASSWASVNDVNVTCPPSYAIPSAADYLCDAVASILINRGLRVVRLRLPSPGREKRVQTHAHDYAMLSYDDRVRAQLKRYRGLCDAVGGDIQNLVIVNDARITGAQEVALADELKKCSDSFSVLWVYIVRADLSSGMSPMVEHFVNSLRVRDANDVIKLGATRPLAITARLARRVLLFTPVDFGRLISTWPKELLVELRVAAEKEGLGAIPCMAGNLDRLLDVT